MITAAGRDNLIDICAVLVLLVLDHNILRYLLGYGIATFFSIDKTSSHTITFEVGLQNSGLASGIALKWDVLPLWDSPLKYSAR